ncbi:hypothetical protein [Pseudoalteromonas gelatinilytica]
MDSIVTVDNSGFKDGVFQYAQTQALPWPKKLELNLAPAVMLDYIGAHRNKLHNPYDENSGYVELYTTSITYYNADGAVLWSFSRADISAETTSIGYGFGSSIYHLINGIPYLIVLTGSSAGGHFVKINLNDLSLTIGGAFSGHAHQLLGILEDGTLYSVGDGYSGNGAKAFVIDDATMNLTSTELVGCGYISNLRYVYSNTSSRQAYCGVSLFNGCLTLINGTLGIDEGYDNSYDKGTLLWGINADADFTNTSLKTPIRTMHSLAVNAFSEIIQLSKDVYFSRREEAFGFTKYMKQYSPLYFSRKELESWASDCIYSAHSIRIPKREA